MLNRTSSNNGSRQRRGQRRRRKVNADDVVDDDTALKVALEISKQEAANSSRIEALGNHGFTEEEILKISEIESNQDSTFTVISCLRSDASDECIFCLEVPVRLDVIRRLRCMHFFHKECFDEYFDAANNQKNMCPICNEKVIENWPESETRGSQSWSDFNLFYIFKNKINMYSVP